MPYSTPMLTYWGRVTRICVSKLTIIGSDNGLSPSRCQAIIWTNAGIVSIWTLGTNFKEILSEIHTFLLMKVHFKMSSGKWWPSCLGPNVLTKDSVHLRPSCREPFSWPLRRFPTLAQSQIIHHSPHDNIIQVCFVTISSTHHNRLGPWYFPVPMNDLIIVTRFHIPGTIGSRGNLGDKNVIIEIVIPLKCYDNVFMLWNNSKMLPCQHKKSHCWVSEWLNLTAFLGTADIPIVEKLGIRRS